MAPGPTRRHGRGRRAGGGNNWRIGPAIASRGQEAQSARQTRQPEAAAFGAPQRPARSDDGLCVPAVPRRLSAGGGGEPFLLTAFPLPPRLANGFGGRGGGPRTQKTDPPPPRPPRTR